MEYTASRLYEGTASGLEDSTASGLEEGTASRLELTVGPFRTAGEDWGWGPTWLEGLAGQLPGAVGVWDMGVHNNSSRALV